MDRSACTKTHRPRGLLSSSSASSVVGSPFSPPQGQWRPEIWQSSSKEVTGSCQCRFCVPHSWAPAHGAAQRSGPQDESGLLSANIPSRGQGHSLYKRTLVLTEPSCTDKGSMRWKLNSVNIGNKWRPLGTECGGGSRWAAGWPPLVPSLWTWPHAISFPISYKLQRAGFPKHGKKKEITIWKIFSLFSAIFLQFQRSLLYKKKKSSVCQDFSTYHIWKGIVFYTFWNVLKMGIKESEAH